jgi:hypothetical protein
MLGTLEVQTVELSRHDKSSRETLTVAGKLLDWDGDRQTVACRLWTLSPLSVTTRLPDKMLEHSNPMHQVILPVR